MYSNPSQTAGWNPNGPPTSGQPGQQPGPPTQSPSQTPAQQSQWSPQANGQFAPRQNQIPPLTQALQAQIPAMQTLQPQHPEQYRALPQPPQMYAPAYPPGPPMQYNNPQPAPRQRTAIACRYCRRRKIRCSGFDQSEDGRCTNCQRFSQECVFTPVSAQTQAFVPAHTVWRGQPPPNAQLYGAYGQPLRQDPYSSQQSTQQSSQYPLPPSQQGYPQPFPQQAAMQAGSQSGSKRPSDEPHTPTLPPPQPGQARPGEYIYPDPSTISAVDRDENGSVDTADRKLERLRNGEVKDIGIQTDDLWEFKPKMPSM